MATEEIVQTLERLQTAFEDLAVRGLRAAGPRDLATLRMVREEFERIGADYLAGQIAAVVQAIENDDRAAAPALLRALANLRVFERVLTLETAAQDLNTLVQATASGEGEGEP